MLVKVHIFLLLPRGFGDYSKFLHIKIDAYTEKYPILHSFTFIKPPHYALVTVLQTAEK